MSLSFALAAEGKTDQRVIENILVGCFRHAPEDITVDWDHPPHEPTKNGDAETWGNWLNVFEYLRRRSYEDALQLHDYVVVHIDTDCSLHQGFDVPRSVDGKTLSTEEFVTAIRDKLKSMIADADQESYAGRFLFAVCVDSIECWLLPLHSPDKATDEHNCRFKVNAGLAKAGSDALNKNLVASYANASAPYRRAKTILSEGRKQPSLALFLDVVEPLRQSLIVRG